MTFGPGFYRDCMRHLVCVPYSISGLHRMARDLGIKRCWFHAGRWPHYDIPKTLELSKFTTLVSPREVLAICKTAPKQLKFSTTQQTEKACS